MGKRCVRALVGVAAVLAMGVGAAQAQLTATLSPQLTTPVSGLNEPWYVTVDASGNLFVGDFGGATVYKIPYSGGVYGAKQVVATGINEAVGVAVDSAGNVYVGQNGEQVVRIPYSAGSYGTPVVIASGFSSHYGVVVDSSGNVFVADTGNGKVKKVPYLGGTSYGTPVVIGSGYSDPYGLSIDAAGNLYIGDPGNDTIEKLTNNAGTYGAVTTLASGVYSYGTAVDKSGNVYFSNVETNALEEIPYSVGTYGTAVTLSSGFAEPWGIAVDGYGNLFVANESTGSVKEFGLGVTNLGTVALQSNATTTLTYVFGGTSGTILAPVVLTQGATGLDFTDAGTGTCTTNGTSHSYASGNTCTVVVKFAPAVPGVRMGAVELKNSAGTVIATTLIYGTGSGPQVTYSPGAISTAAGNGTAGYVASQDTGTTAATSADMDDPFGVAVDGAGNLYIADYGNQRIRKVTAATGAISTVAGNGSQGYVASQDTGTTAATSAELNGPTGVAVDGAGNLYIADYGNQRIRKVTAATGFISTVAGNGTAGYVASQDTGTTAATSAELSFPEGVAVDGAGNLYIADSSNQRIRKVTAATGFISTVAGNGTAGYVASQDTGTTAATSAELKSPRGVAVDGAGSLYIADQDNQRIRKVAAATGFISTVAGNGTAGYVASQDTGTTAATSAELNYPFGVAVDGAGNLYIADQSNQRIRKVAAATGFISTVAGNGAAGYVASQDTGTTAATSAELDDPEVVAVDGAGNLYIADSVNYRIRKVTASAAPLSFASTAVGATSSDSPQTVIVNNIGNSLLTFANPATGGNPSISTGFSIGNSSTCPQLTSGSSAGTLAAGASCTDLISFSPTVGGNIGGQLVTTDNTLNVSGSFQTATLNGMATYPTPTVTSLTPANGPTTGGNVVTITGTNLDQVNAVNFGSVAATSFMIVSNTSITAVAPAGTSGLVYVTVSNPGFTSANSVQYTYNAPVVNSISPSYGPAAGGGTITITGANLSGATSVNFGAVPATILTNTSTSITATIPAGTAATTVNVNVTAGGTVSNSVLYTYSAPSAYTAPTEPVGTASATQTAYVNITTAGTLSAINVLTKGSPNVDFKLVSGGTCTTTTVYSVGQACSVEYSFTPTAAGVRIGGITLVNSAGAVLGSSYLGGTGTAPVGVFNAGVQSTFYNVGDGGQNGMTLDGAGDLYYSDYASGAVYEVRVGTQTPIVIASGLGVVTDVAVDGIGDVFYGSDNQNTIFELKAGSTTPILLDTPLNPEYFAVDAAGNLFAAIAGAHVVKEYLANGTTATFGTGLSHPQAIALDASDNIYLTDRGLNEVLKITPENVQTVLASGFGFPVGIAMDPAGNIYVADTANNAIDMLAAGTYALSQVSSGWSAPKPLFMDAAGNLYVANTGTGTIIELNRSAGSLSFGSTSYGTTSGVQQTAFVNIGNEPLAISAVTASANFLVDASNTCSVGSLASGANCVLAADFAPQAVGPFTGTLTVTDNSLNQTAFAQITSLSGTATQASQTISFTAPASPVTYGAAPIALVATGGASGNAVTFSILSGAAYGSISGNTLTVTGAGTIVIAANQAGNTNYSAATPVTQTLTVNPASQTITFGALPGVTWGAADFPVSASSTSGLTVSFAASGNCTIVSATTVHITSAGSCQITASQAGNANYTAATGVTESFAIAQEPITATGGSGSAVYDGTTKTPSACTVTGNYTVGLGCFNVPSTVGPNAGTTAITASVTGINSNYIVTQVGGSYTINQAASVITVSCPASVTYTGLPQTPCTAAVTGVGGLNQSLPVSYGANITAGLASASATYAGDTNHTASAGSTAFTILPAAQVITFTPVPTSPDFAGDSVVLSATGGPSGQPVVFSVLSGPATLANDGVTLLYTGAGTVVVAADQAASDDGNYAAATEATATIVVNPAAAAYNAGTVPVAQQSGILTATLNFPNGGTIGSLNYLTQGAPNLDFIGCTPGPKAKQPANPKGGSPRQTTFTCPSSKSKSGAAIPVCSVGDVYSAGQICTVSYIFQPTAPGQRLGAVTAVDSNGNPMGTSLLSGLGTGPQAAFYPGTQSVIDGSNAGDPFEIATDAAGDIYLGSYGTSQVLKYTPNGGGYTQSTIGSGFGTVAQIAVDGAGNLLVADPQSSQIFAETLNPSNGQYTQSVPFNSSNSSDNSVWAVAKDASGNVFLSGSGQLLKESPLPAGGYAETVLPFSFNFVTSLALDSSGDLFVADAGAGTLYELTNNGGGNYTQSVVVSGYGNLNGVAVDASGVVYASSTSTGSVLRYAPVAGGGYAPLAPLGGGFARLNGVGLDSAGNVYVADDGGPNTLSVIQVSSPAPLSFADTNVGSSSSDSPQTVTIANIGYDPTSINPLTFGGVSTGTTSFVLDATNACTGSTSLEPGQTCALAVDFTPQAPGTPLTDAVTLVDNNLNNIGSASSPQTVALSGNGLQQTPVIAVAPATIDYATASTTLSATVAYAGSIAPTGAVTFTIDSGSAVAASCSGTASPLSCTATYPTATLSATTHTITATLAATPGFLAASGTNMLTVNPIALTVTAGSYTGVYDGNTHALSACTVSPNPDGLTCTNSPAGPVGPDVGHAVVVPVPSGPTSNYIVGVGLGSWTITPAVLTVNAGSYTGVYDGNTHALSACTVSPNPDGLTCTNSPAGPVGPGVGHAGVVPVLSGPTSNYIVGVGLGSWTITPAVLTVTAGSYTGVYDGNTHALSACTVSPNPDGLTCTNSPAGPVGPDVGHAGVVPVLSGPTSNYIVGVGLGSWTITSRPVTLSAGSYTGTYDGSAHTVPACATTYAGVTCTNAPASVGPGVGSGAIQPVAVLGTAIAADYQFSPQQGSWSIAKAATVTTLSCPVSVVYNGTAQTPCTANVTGAGGLNQPVPVTYGYNTVVGQAAASANFTGDANYQSSSATTTFQITPAPLTVTAGSYSGVYDGASHIVSACTVSANPDGLGCRNSLGTVGPDVGAGAVTPIANAPTTNYTVTSVNGSWSITPLPVTVTAGSYSGVYDGATHAPSACTSSYAGVTCTNSPASVGPGVGSGPVTAVVSYGTGSAADYTLTKATGTYSIAPAPASITPNAATKVYGTADPTLTGTTTGFLPADSIVVSYSRTAGQTVVGSPYTISASVAPNAALSNYRVTYNTAAFAIMQASASVTPTAATKVYGTPDPTLTGTLTGFLGSDNVVATYSRTAGSTVGSYTISATLSPTTVLANYNITYNTAAFSITKLAASVTPNAATKVYGTADPAFTGSLSGFLPADNVTATYSRVSGETVAGSPYAISATLSPAAVLLNYAITYNTAGFTIAKATPVLTWANPAAIAYGTALSAAQLSAAANLSGGTFGYMPSAGTVLGAGSQTLSVTYTPADTADYTTATASVPLTVGQATPVVAWPNPPSIVYGTGTGTAQKTATASGVGGASLPGSFFYTTPDGTVFAVGNHTLGVGFTPTDITDYVPVSAYATLTVTKATPTVKWVAPAAIAYGTALSSAQLNATASVPGSFSYSPAAGTVLNAGAQTLSVTFTPNDSTDYNPVATTTLLTVNQATPVVTWANPPSIVYGTGTGAAQKTATATGVGGVSLPGSYFYTTPDGTIFTVGTHTLGVGFTPTDSTDYVSVSAYATLTVTKATPAVTWAAPAAITYGTALSSAQLNATASVPGTFVYTPAAGTVLQAGAQTLSVTFTPNDTSNYSPFTTTVPLTVNKATPVITWPTPAGITYGTPLSATQLDATANVAGTFAYTASTGPNPLGVLLTPGTTALSATLMPTDTVDYNPVTAYVVFTISKAQSTTTLAVTTTQTVTGTTATLTATVKPQIGGTPTGTVTFYNGSTALGSAAVGTPFTTGVLPVGTDQITAVYGGDSNFVGSSSSASAVVSVAPTAVQLTSPLGTVFYPASAVSFTVIVPLKNLQLIGGTVTLYDGATAIGTYSLPAGGILVGITPQLGVGTHTLRAVYGGNGQYPPGQSPVVVVTVAAL